MKVNDIPSIFFSNAVKNVIYTMAGLEVVETKVPDEGEEDFAAQISGVVLITGLRNIMISLTVSKPMAFALVSFMTGIQTQDLNEAELYDGVSELTNMIAGETRAQLAGRGYHFNVLPPFAVVGDRHCLIHKNKVENLVKKYHAGDNAVYLRVYFL